MGAFDVLRWRGKITIVKRKKFFILGLTIIILMIIGRFCWLSQKEKQINEQKTEAKVKAEPESEIETVELSERLEKIRKTGKATLVIENVLVQKKDSVKIRVWIVNNPGIAGMSTILSYDQNVLTLDSAKNGTEFQDVLSFNCSKDRSDGCVFLWTEKTLRKRQIFDGVLLTMEFKIKDGEKSIKTPIRLIPEMNGTYDKDLKEVGLETDNGYVTVIRE